MKKAKRLAALLAALCLLLLTACNTGGASSGANSGSSNGDGSSGRYVETDITPPGAGDELLQVLQADDGSLIAFTNGLKTRFDSNDGGETWQESPGPGAADSRLAGAAKVVPTPDGGFIALVNDQPTDYGMPISRLVKIDADGSVSDYALPEYDEALADGKSPYISMLHALGNGGLFLSYSYGGGMGTIDPDMEGADDTDAPGDDALPDGEPADALATGDLAANIGGTSETDDNDGNTQFFSVGGDYFSGNGLYDIATGEKIADWGDEMVLSVTDDGSLAYLLGYDGSVSMRSLTDGSHQGNIPAPAADGDDYSFNFNMMLAVGQENSLYLADSKKLARLQPDGSSEKITDSAPFAFGSSNAYLQGFYALGNDVFAMQVTQNSGARLLRYAYDPNANVDPNKVLEVWALKDNETVRTAIAEFLQANPDATVHFENALQDSTQDASDAIRTLVTRILAGEGPDVILLDGCPVDSFAQKGMLLNLADLLDTSGIYDEITSPFTSDGGIFMLPARFKIPLLLSADGGKNMQTLEDFVNAVVQGNDAPPVFKEGDDPNQFFSAMAEDERPTFQFDDLRELFDLLWNSSAGEIITSNGLDTEQLRSFLAAIKQVSDKYDMTGEVPSGGAAMAYATTGGGGTVITGGAIAYASGRANYAGLLAADIATPVVLGADETQYSSFPGLAQGAWLPDTLAGINAGTKNPTLAAEFMQTLFSDTVQGASTGGYPVTSAGAQQQVETYKASFAESDMADFSFDMDTFIKTLKTPIMPDNTLTDTFYNAAELYCKGETDLDTAVANIEQEVRNYLAERSY